MSQPPSSPPPPPPPPRPQPRKLAISLAVSLLFVCSAILLVTATTTVLLCYCRRRRDRNGSESGNRVPSATPSGGIDAAAAIGSLTGAETTTMPAFSYAPQDGEHGVSALECAVCLGAVKEGDMVRQLPACMHVYHVGCIDRWLAVHPTCPVCRSIAA